MHLLAVSEVETDILSEIRTKLRTILFDKIDLTNSTFFTLEESNIYDSFNSVLMSLSIEFEDVNYENYESGPTQKIISVTNQYITELKKKCLIEF